MGHDLRLPRLPGIRDRHRRPSSPLLLGREGRRSPEPNSSRVYVTQQNDGTVSVSRSDPIPRRPRGARVSRLLDQLGLNIVQGVGKAIAERTP